MKFKADYSDQINQYYDQFLRFAKKQLSLDGNHNLNYQHEGSWVIVSISTKNNVTIIEAFKFFEKVIEVLYENE